MRRLMHPLISARVLPALFAGIIATTWLGSPTEVTAAEEATGAKKSEGWTKAMSQSELARDLGDFKKSHKFLQEALKKSPPGFPTAVTNTQLTEVLLQLGEYQKARDAAKKALAMASEISQIPELRGQVLEAYAHALFRTEGDKAEIEQSSDWALKIRQDRNSPLTPRYTDYGLRHNASGFWFAAKLGDLHRLNAKRASKDAPHVAGSYTIWLGKSAVFAHVIVHPKSGGSLRQSFDRVRAVMRQRLKGAKRLSKGDFKAAKSLGLKGLEAQWTTTPPDKSSKLWHGLYFLEHGRFFIQIRSRALATEAKRAAMLIDGMARSFKWGHAIKN
jgi:tetratricopeptide (TPR) repeat protein